MITSEWEVVCFGPSHKFAMAASTRFKIVGIVNENQRFNQSLYDFAILRQIKYFPVSSKEQFKNSHWRAELGLSFGFGLIFNERQIDSFGRGIWNIHPGKLPKYRGRHTVGWAIINGETELTVSLHAINHEIDKGMLLAEELIPMSELDSQAELERLIENTACRKLLDKGIAAELNGNKTEITDGSYLPPLDEKWNIIDPQKIDGLLLYRIMKTKKKYGGIQIGEKHYRDCQFVFDGARATYNEDDIFICRDGIEVYLK